MKWYLQRLFSREVDEERGDNTNDDTPPNWRCTRLSPSFTHRVLMTSWGGVTPGSSWHLHSLWAAHTGLAVLG